MTIDYAERDRQRAAMAFDPVQKAKGYNSHPSGVETVQVTEWLLGMTATAVKYVWRRGEKWETQLVRTFRQLYDKGGLIQGVVWRQHELTITEEDVQRAKRDAVIQDLEKALWCFQREVERMSLPQAMTFWDGNLWRPPAVRVILHDGNTVLGRCLAALLLVPDVATHKAGLGACCEYVRQEIERLKAEREA